MLHTQETLAALVTSLISTVGRFADWTNPRPFAHQGQGDGLVKRPGMAVSLPDCPLLRAVVYFLVPLLSHL